MKTAIGLILTNGGVALIDPEDAHLARFKWFWSKYRDRPAYVLRTDWKKGDEIPRELHRAVMRAPPRIGVDHRSGDTFDNRRENLRLNREGVNNRNLAGANRNSGSQVRGVTWHAKSGKWQAVIASNGRLQHLGIYEDIEDARRARADAERRLWGVEPRRAAELDRYAPA